MYYATTIVPTASGDLLLSIKKQTSCLKRFKHIQVSSNYLVTQDTVVGLNKICSDEPKDVVFEVVSGDGSKKLIFRMEEKDLWVEVWSKTLNGGLLQSCKISTVCSRLYLDGAFGFVSWARDLSKVCFIGESAP